MVNIYVSSQIKHADYWKAWRQDLKEFSDLRIISTWIDLTGEDLDFEKMWVNIIEEVKQCDVLVLYNDSDVRLEGCNVEVGVALSEGILVYAVGVEERWRTLKYHPLIKKYDGVGKVFDVIEEAWPSGKAVDC